MVYYIRFLKTPRFVKARSRENPTAQATITITSDLGDQFYAGNLSLIVRVLRDGDHGGAKAKALPWKNGMRALPFSIFLDNSDDNYWKPRRLQVSEDLAVANPLSLNELPRVVSGLSATFNDYDERQAEKRVERQFSLDGFGVCDLRIWEETGESIARHIWDAGLGLVAYLKDSTSTQSNGTVPSQSTRILSAQNPARLSVLELGSGCGIVGIALAQMRPRCDVLLTDLPEAMEILGRNISIAQPSEGSDLTKTTLDWEDDIPRHIRERAIDVILISDCTYNSDSLPALVRTLSNLTLSSMEAQVILSMKVRHSSEAAFFDLMSDAGFVEVEHSSIDLPDRLRSQRGERRELVEIYVFCHKTVGVSP